MFSNPYHYDVFKKLEKAMRYERIDAFLAILHVEFQSLCKSRDELRMLFYITIYSPQKIFAKALRYYKKQKLQTEDYQERIPILSEALFSDAKQTSRLEKKRIEYIVRHLGHTH